VNEHAVLRALNAAENGWCRPPTTRRGEMRNPKDDPKPGDEMFAPKLKAKVVSILVGEKGIERVSYQIGPVSGTYDKQICTGSLANWARLVKSPKITTVPPCVVEKADDPEFDCPPDPGLGLPDVVDTNSDAKR